MLQLNSGSWRSALPESKVVAFPLQQENSENPLRTRHNNGELNKESNFTKTSSEQQLGYLLSNLLKYGVFLASAVVFVGGVLYLIRHGAEPAKYQVFQGEPSEFLSPFGVLKAFLSGSSLGTIQFGLLILIATPFIRVIISFLAFLKWRDFTYVIVTSLVLAGLTYSLVGAYLF